MNPFEEYLRKNKNRLTKEEESSKDLWDNISNRLHRRKLRRIWTWTAIAATFALLLSVGTFIKVHIHQGNMLPLPLYSYSDEYGEVEQEYANEINFQLSQIDHQKIPLNKADVLEGFVFGMKELDKAYAEYCCIIETEGCDEIMMELIIENYRRRLDLLENLKLEITKINRYEDKTNAQEIKVQI